MSITKRLDEIGTSLRPKDWAIRLVDELRPCRSMNDFMIGQTKASPGDAIWYKPLDVFEQQANHAFPGRKTEHDRNRTGEYFKRFREFGILKGLVITVNQAIENGQKRLA